VGGRHPAGRAAGAVHARGASDLLLRVGALHPVPAPLACPARRPELDRQGLAGIRCRLPPALPGRGALVTRLLGSKPAAADRRIAAPAGGRHLVCLAEPCSSSRGVRRKTSAGSTGRGLTADGPQRETRQPNAVQEIAAKKAPRLVGKPPAPLQPAALHPGRRAASSATPCSPPSKKTRPPRSPNRPISLGTRSLPAVRPGSGLPVSLDSHTTGIPSARLTELRRRISRSSGRVCAWTRKSRFTV